MKHIKFLPLIVLLGLSFSSLLNAQEVSVDIAELEFKAKSYAQSDAKKKSTGAWVGGSTLASLLASPLLGGGLTIIMAYNTGGDVNVPAAYTMDVKNKYGENYDALRIFSDYYEREYKSLVRKKQGGSAWMGTGIGFVINLAILSAILSE